VPVHRLSQQLITINRLELSCPLYATLQRFRGGVLGGELLTLSRYPIVTVRIADQVPVCVKRPLISSNDIGHLASNHLLQAHFEPYRVSGNPAAVWHGDFFAGKGIGHTRIDTPSGLVVRRCLHGCAAGAVRHFDCITHHAAELQAVGLCRMPTTRTRMPATLTSTSHRRQGGHGGYQQT
jgi:hypothetical protein